MDFEAVYGKYGDMLFRTAFMYSGDSHSAEDILLDVFIAYFTSKKHFESEEHRKAWLIRVTHNKCINYLRAPSRKNIDIDELQLIREEKDTDTRLDILKQIAALPPSYKSVIILHYYNDYSVEEIARILKITKSAVKMRLKRGRDTLKIQLEDTENE